MFNFDGSRLTVMPVLMQGKPSSKTPKKKRFFQLSHDGSTLRWSWNKYIIMYYVEVGMHASDYFIHSTH